jgi:hypothetical protein
MASFAVQSSRLRLCRRLRYGSRNDAASLLPDATLEPSGTVRDEVCSSDSENSGSSEDRRHLLDSLANSPWVEPRILLQLLKS